MADIVHKLLLTAAAIEKVGRRGISPSEANQLRRNRYLVLPNPLEPERRLLVGVTDGGRLLTLVIERTLDPADWVIVTGWDSANHERRMLRR